jgi:hypothetical protein
MKATKFDTQVRVVLRTMCEVVRKPREVFLKKSGYISSLTPYILCLSTGIFKKNYD